MKKHLKLLIFAGLMSCFASVEATKYFNIVNGTSDVDGSPSPNITNIRLTKMDGVTSISISPTSDTLSYPGSLSIQLSNASGITQFIYSFQVSANNKTYTVSGTGTPSSTNTEPFVSPYYTLIYNSTIDAMQLQSH